MTADINTPRRNRGPRGLAALFWVGIAFTAIVPAAIGVSTGSASVAGVVAACGVFITIAPRLGDVSELSLGLLRAKMRETIAEATATVEQLHEVAATMTSTLLTDLMAGGFMGGMTLADRLKHHDQLMDQLTRVGVSDEQKRRAEAAWRNGIGVIYQRIIRQEINKAAGERTGNAGFANICADGFNALLDFKSWRAPSPAQMRQYCETHNVLTPTISEWIEDYRHYLETNEIKRRSEFEKG